MEIWVAIAIEFICQNDANECLGERAVIQEFSSEEACWDFVYSGRASIAHHGKIDVPYVISCRETHKPSV